MTDFIIRSNARNLNILIIFIQILSITPTLYWLQYIQENASAGLFLYFIHFFLHLVFLFISMFSLKKNPTDLPKFSLILFFAALGTTIIAGSTLFRSDVDGINYFMPPNIILIRIGFIFYLILILAYLGFLVISKKSIKHQNDPKSTPSRKNKIIAGIFGILLGDLGIHQFYLGNIGNGLLMLLFCWTGIPGLIGFIEGIIILGMSHQEFARKYEVQISGTNTSQLPANPNNFQTQPALNSKMLTNTIISQSKITNTSINPQNDANNQNEYGYCPKCGRSLEGWFEFCPKCGNKLPKQ